MNKFPLFFWAIFAFPFLLSAQADPFECRSVLGDGTLLCTQRAGSAIEVYSLDSLGMVHYTRMDEAGTIEAQNNLGTFINDSLIVRGNQLIRKSATGVITGQKPIPASILALFEGNVHAAAFGDNSILFSGICKELSGNFTNYYRVLAHTNNNLNLLETKEEFISIYGSNLAVNHSYRLSNGNVVVMSSADAYNGPSLVPFTDIRVYNSTMELISTRRLENQTPDALYRTPCGSLLILGNYHYNYFHSSSFNGDSRYVLDVEQNEIVSSFIDGIHTRNYIGSFLVKTLRSAPPDSLTSNFEVAIGSNPIPDLIFIFPAENGNPADSLHMQLLDYNHAIPTAGNSLLLFGENNGELWVLNPECNTPKPDVRPTFAMTVPSTISNGDDLQVQWSMNNIGDADAENFQFKVYLSDDNLPSSDDIIIQTQYIQNLPAGQSFNGSTDWKLSMFNTKAGQKHVLFVADAEDVLVESDESNNTQVVFLQVALNEAVTQCVKPFAVGEFLCSQMTGGVTTVYTKSNELLYKHIIQKDGSFSSSDIGFDRRDSVLVVGNDVVKKAANGTIIYDKEIPLSIRIVLGNGIKAAELPNGELVLVGWKRQAQYNPTTSNLMVVRLDANMALLDSKTLRSITHEGPLMGAQDVVMGLINLPNDQVDVLYKYGTFGAQLLHQTNSGIARIDANLNVLHEQVLPREEVVQVSLTPCLSYKMYTKFDAGDHIHTNYGGQKEHYMSMDAWNTIALRTSGAGGNQADGSFEQLDYRHDSPYPLFSDLKWRSSFEPLPDMEFLFQVSFGSESEIYPYLPYIYAQRNGLKSLLFFGYQNDSLWVFSPECLDTPPPSICDNNVLENPGFDQQLTGWNGDALLQMTPNHLTVCTNYGAARQTKQTEAGKSYTLRVDTYKDVGVTGVIGFKFLSKTWQVLQEDYMGITTGAFNNMTTTKTAPAGAAYVEVSLVKTNAVSGCIHADNWCLEDNSGGGCSPDVIPPTITCPDDLYVTTTGTTGVAEWLYPDTDDNCGNAIAVGSHQSSMAYLVGTHTVVYTSTDDSGNTATCSFTITVSEQVTGDCTNNLLDNPDFDAQNITGWSGGAAYKEINGKRFITVCTTGETALQTKPAEAGKLYKLNVWASLNSSTTYGVIGLKFLSSNWNVLDSEYKGISTVSFEQISIEKMAPANTAYVEVSLIKTGGISCVNADDWCLTTDSPITSTCVGDLLENPSYANGSSNQWNGTFTIDDDAQSNTYWAQVCETGKYVYQTKVAVAGQKFDFSAEAYKDNGTEGILTIKFMGSNWSVLEQNFINVATGSFQTVQKSVSAPAQTAWIEVSAYKSGGNGCIYVTDWCLTTPNLPLVKGAPIEPIQADVDVLMYPNPATRYVVLNLKGYEGEDVDILLLDQYGKIVQSTLNKRLGVDNQQIRLNIEQVWNGQYFLQIRCEGKRTIVKKLVVSRLY